MTTQIFQFDIFQIVPNTFIRVQVRGISWQLFQMKALGCTLAQKLLDSLRPMSRQAVPKDQHLTRNMAQQMLEKSNNGRAIKRFVLGPGVQLTRWSDGANHRQMFPRRILQNGRLSSWGIGSDGGRQQIKTGFINKNYGALFFFGFFLRVGHCSVRHCSIAASLRWLARSIGFWRLHPIFSKIRPTCRAEYVTSNLSLMSLPTRPRVQTSPRKPYASAPCSNNFGNSLSWASLSRGLGPPPVRLWSASTPACCPRLTH